MAAPEALHRVGQPVWVLYDDGNYYQGKALKREAYEKLADDGTPQKVWRYFVHYMGWNKNYDEWVDEPLCLKQNPNSGVAGAALKKSKAHPGAGGKMSKPQMVLAIPADLKQHLVTERDTVKSGKCVPLPRTVTVENLLDQYLERVKSARQDDGDVEANEQVVFGLRNYFDNSLRQGWSILLYNEERAAADRLLADGKLASMVFGAEHLLRLFVKLPALLNIDGTTLEQYRHLQQKLHDVLETLRHDYSTLFVPFEEYEPVSEAPVAADP